MDDVDENNPTKGEDAAHSRCVRLDRQRMYRVRYLF